ncbi:Hypothetical predicted protein, partial [Paramuricea clavata]
CVYLNPHRFPAAFRERIWEGSGGSANNINKLLLLELVLSADFNLVNISWNYKGGWEQSQCFSIKLIKAHTCYKQFQQLHVIDDNMKLLKQLAS